MSLQKDNMILDVLAASSLAASHAYSHNITNLLHTGIWAWEIMHCYEHCQKEEKKPKYEYISVEII